MYLQSCTRAAIVVPLLKGIPNAVDFRSAKDSEDSLSDSTPHLRLEFASATTEYITDYIKFADAKAGATIGFVTLALGGTGVLFEKSLSDLRVGMAILMSIALLIIFISSLVAIFYSIDALRPRSPTTTFKSIASFPDIAAMTEVEFLSAFAGQSTEGMVEARCYHNSILAKLAVAKYRSVSNAVFASQIVLYSTASMIVLSAVNKILIQSGCAQ
jgi:hypothetical protein